MLRIYNHSSVIFLFFTVFICICCENDTQYTLISPEQREEYSGGEFTVFNTTANAFGLAGPILSIPEQKRFGVGNSLFNQNWVTAPASTATRDGLGPLFNARACSNCHFKDGRGRPPLFNNELNHGLVLQLSNGINSTATGSVPHPIYGDQLQDQALLGVPTEGKFSIKYITIYGSYPDGETYELRKPVYKIHGSGGKSLSNIYFSPRVAPQIIGMGLLGAISDTDILANQDIQDADGDDISGKANFVWNILEQKMTLGKYGWKANQPTLNQQNASAFSNDLGITNSLFPNEKLSKRYRLLIYTKWRNP